MLKRTIFVLWLQKDLENHSSICLNFVSTDHRYRFSDNTKELITTTLKVAEMSKVVYEELPNYTKEELLADIGGALGLILGLNLLDALVFSGTVLKRVTHMFCILCRYGTRKLHPMVRLNLQTY